MSVQIQFIGSGDAFGSGGRFQSCFLLTDSRGRIAIDFGATSLIGLQRQGIHPASLDLIIVSHLHGDHFSGLPFLLLYLQKQPQSPTPLILAGPPGFVTALKKLFLAMYPHSWQDEWSFPLQLIEIEPKQPVTLAGRTITTVEVAHAEGIGISTGIRVACDAKIIAYSGDTSWTEELVQLAKDSDLFICECNFLSENGSSSHLDYATLKKNVSRLHSRRLILTHLGDDALQHREHFQHEIAEDNTIITLQ